MSSPMSSSSSRLACCGAVTSSRYTGCSCCLQWSTTCLISASVIHAPCMRMDLLAPIGRNRPSPWPTSFSAPGWSRMTRLSVIELVANESRLGTLALIRPVTTSTEGL